MRPDEHKKKRSAQYNKKKTGKGDKPSQSGDKFGNRGKQKHVETKPGDGGAGARNSPSSSSSDDEEKSRSTHNTSKGDINKPTFKRRTIVSNWDRYEVAEEAPTSTVQCESADFSKLLSISGSSTSHFRFKDEQDWECEVSAGDGASTGRSVLAVDCAELAASLDCLPLYQRLGLASELFPEEQRKHLEEIATKNRIDYEVECQQNQTSQPSGDIIQPVTNTCSPVDSFELAVNGDQPNKREFCASDQGALLDLNVLLAKHDIEQDDNPVELDKSHRKAFGTKDHQERLKANSGSSKSNYSEDKNNIVETNSTGSMLETNQNVLASCQEEELDFLLSLDTPQKHGSVDLKEQQQDITVEQMDTKNISETGALSQTATNSCHQTTETEGKATENLEDWLDSMLDD